MEEQKRPKFPEVSVSTLTDFAEIWLRPMERCEDTRTEIPILALIPIQFQNKLFYNEL